jgi:hypothetical protein
MAFGKSSVGTAEELMDGTFSMKTLMMVYTIFGFAAFLFLFMVHHFASNTELNGVKDVSCLRSSPPGIPLPCG